MSGTPPTRLPKLLPDTLDEARREVYDAIAGGPRAAGPQLFRLVDDEGGLEGPFNAFLLQPRLGLALQDLGAAVRYGTDLSDRCREIAILVVAHHWDSGFERYAHEAVGRHAGLTEVELAALRRGDDDALAGAAEQLVARTCRALVGAGDLDEAQYSAAVAGLGRAGVFELLTLVGYYATLALQLRVFRVEAPASPGPDTPLRDSSPTFRSATRAQLSAPRLEPNFPLRDSSPSFRSAEARLDDPSGLDRP